MSRVYFQLESRLAQGRRREKQCADGYAGQSALDAHLKILPVGLWEIGSYGGRCYNADRRSVKVAGRLVSIPVGWYDFASAFSGACYGWRYSMKRRFAASLLACLLSPLFSAQAAEPAIAAAARDENRAAALALISQHSGDVNARLTDGTTALHWAVRSDDLEMVSALLQAKADANAADPHGVTPLAIACANANTAIVRALLTGGAKPDIADAAGSTPLMAAVRRPNVENIRLLLDAGAGVNARDNKAQETALMVAVRENNLAAVKLLVDHKADVNAATRAGKAPARRPPGAGGGSHGVG